MPVIVIVSASASASEIKATYARDLLGGGREVEHVSRCTIV